MGGLLKSVSLDFDGCKKVGFYTSKGHGFGCAPTCVDMRCLYLQCNVFSNIGTNWLLAKGKGAKKRQQILMFVSFGSDPPTPSTLLFSCPQQLNR